MLLFRNYIFAQLQPFGLLLQYYIPRGIMYASNDVQQQIFVHCAFPVFIMCFKTVDMIFQWLFQLRCCCFSIIVQALYFDDFICPLTSVFNILFNG